MAILDADKEGFLRSERSLIQTAGRAARNVAGRVVLYADRVTDSMRRATDEMNRRREKQLAYNEEHGITPRTIVKTVEEILQSTSVADAIGTTQRDELRELLQAAEREDPQGMITRLEGEMLQAARDLDFERAASLRDRVDDLRAALAEHGGAGETPSDAARPGARERLASGRSRHGGRPGARGTKRRLRDR